jgi:hypothetical protein
MSNGTNRRTALRNGLLVLGGAIGLGGGAAGTKAFLSEPAAKRNGEKLELAGLGLVAETPNRVAGERLQPGDRSTVSGRIVDPKTKRDRGRFYGTRTVFDSGLTPFATADASTELHTFALEDGSILGMGSIVGGVSAFTVVGGTGRYAGKRGTYVAEQRLRELGGDGTASFVINLEA